MMRAALALVAAATLAGCYSVPNPKTQAGAPKVAPDRQYIFEIGTTKQRVLVWDCLGGKRIVWTNSCGQFNCDGEWAAHKSECGDANGWWDVDASRRKPIPPGSGW